MLLDTIKQHVNELTICIADEHENSDEKSGKSSSVFDSLYNEGGRDEVKFMTKITPAQFN